MGLRPFLLLLAATAALAADPPSPAPSAAPAAPLAAASGFTLSADLRAEYIQGQPVLVTLAVANDGKETRNFPDLAQRPHLVTFELLRDGATQRRFNTPPEQDPDQNWRIAPGARREVLLEIPSGAGIPAGEYQLTVKVKVGDGELAFGPKPIRVVAPKAVAASGPWQAATAEKAGIQTAWVHQGAKGAQLYLHVADAARPGVTVGNYFLGDLPGAVEPVLTWALPSQAWGRHVYWLEGTNTIGSIELDGPGRAGAVQRFTAPWPKVELLGVGVTDEEGGLYVPLWVPAPKGGGGEVRVLGEGEKGTPQLRKVAAFTEKPSHVTTAVDGAGNLRLVLHHGGVVDQYTVDTNPANTLPAKGQRLASPEGTVPIVSRFGVLPAAGEEKGGLALLVVDRITAPDGAAKLQGRWLSTQGSTLRTLDAVAAPKGDVVDVLPSGADSFTLLVRGADGALSAFSRGKTTPVPSGVDPELLLDSAGSPYVRTWGAKTPAILAL